MDMKPFTIGCLMLLPFWWIIIGLIKAKKNKINVKINVIIKMIIINTKIKININSTLLKVPNINVFDNFVAYIQIRSY